ncbi:hypothetical protein F8S13_17850 [Chloroflexia bacterium SDU3-3]|nr:hypothetical protein F8S13_17850 [Chloroflexia bacterium SDU3-3]
MCACNNCSGSVSIGQAAESIAATQGVTQRCVSLASGALSPDQRVSYEFGMVLGVDDFRQEQLYFLEKEYQHNRGLHGFGTVYGLRVLVAPPQGSQEDLQITVEPGMAIDQYGRAIVVRSSQCARLGAWLAKQVQADPGLIERQRAGISGDLSLYVVLRYAECADALVPIPGQPCDSAADSMAPSRIRDSFAIELRWEPPAMPAWDAVRRFGALTGLIRAVPGLPPIYSDEALLADLVRLLDDPEAFASALDTMLAGSLSDAPRELFRLPAEDASAALDRLYTIWASEVRPRQGLPPELSAPEPPAEAGVLLAKIDFLPEEPFDPQQPAIAYPLDASGAPAQPSAEGRPFLLHTQLIQELRTPGAATEKRPFATLAARDGSTLRVWLHYPEIVDLPAASALELTVEGGPVSLREIVPVGPNIFDLLIEPAEVSESPQGPPLRPGALVALGFVLAEVAALGLPLIETIDTQAVDYLGRAGGLITAYTVVSDTAAISTPAQEFATVQSVLIDGALRFRVWFHTPAPIILPNTITVQRGVGDSATQHRFSVVPTTTRSGMQFFWVLAPPTNLRLNAGDVLTFQFDTYDIHLGDGRVLADQIAEYNLSYLGHDGIGSIRAYHIVSPPIQPGLSEEEVSRLIQDALSRLPQASQKPALPLATISQVSANADYFVLELWFHPSPDPESNKVAIDPSFSTEQFRILAEFSEIGEMGDVTQQIGVEPGQPNVFHLFINQNSWRDISRGSRWLRFIFFSEQIMVNVGDEQTSLSKLGEQLPFTFAGSYGRAGEDQRVVIYYRLPDQEANNDR